VDKHPDWERYWSNTVFSPLSGTNFFTQIFNVFVPEVQGQLTAVEIGCFPGRFIEYIGQKGYVISGIDTCPKVLGLNQLFRERGLRIGAFSNINLDDFFGRFGLVFSVGFIEHFANWPKIIMKHIECTKPGGRVIINCPNFATPLQRAMHQTVDKTNCDQHVLSAMYPALWGAFLRLVGMDLLYCDYIGPFQFWTETGFHPDSNEYKLQQALQSAGNWLHKIKGDFETKESGYCLAVADKPRDWVTDHGRIEALCAEFQALSTLLDAKDQLLADQLQQTFITALSI
jgi:SAM-dependent methyltransferase